MLSILLEIFWGLSIMMEVWTFAFCYYYDTEYLIGYKAWYIKYVVLCHNVGKGHLFKMKQKHQCPHPRHLTMSHTKIRAMVTSTKCLLIAIHHHTKPRENFYQLLLFVTIDNKIDWITKWNALDGVGVRKHWQKTIKPSLFGEKFKI